MVYRSVNSKKSISMLEVRRFVNTPVSSNCFILFDKEVGKDCIIVDPGSREEEELFAFLTNESLSPLCIILTHEHFDHCWGVNQIVKRYPVPIVCSELCAEAIKSEKRNCSVFFDNSAAFTISEETTSIESIDRVLHFGNHLIRFYHTPGHTDAGISFVIGQYLFTGDTLIKDENTVTKLPTGSSEKLKASFGLYESMQNKGFIVCSGHGETFLLDQCSIGR